MAIFDTVGAFFHGGMDEVNSVRMNGAVRQSLKSLNEPTTLVESIAFNDKNDLVITRQGKENEGTKEILILSYDPAKNSFSDFNENSGLTKNQVMAHAIVLLILKGNGKRFKIPTGLPSNQEFNNVLGAYIKKYLSGKCNDVSFEKDGKDWYMILDRQVQQEGEISSDKSALQLTV